VRYTLSGDAAEGRDFEKLSGALTIPPGKNSAPLAITPLASAKDGAMAVIRLAVEQPEYHVGCPSQSLIVIRP
jgi:hypothetical protein